MKPNHTLRTIRESLNLSIQEVADRASVSFRTVHRAEKGYPLNPGSRQRLCNFFAAFGIAPEELCLIPQRRRNAASKQSPDRPDALQTTAREMLVTMRTLEQEGIDMNRSRRSFLQTLGAAGVALVAIPQEVLHTSTAVSNIRSQIDISASTIENLSALEQEYRSLQRAGFATEEGLRSLIGLIQSALENTVHDHYRRELWRLQAQAQLLARHAITKKQELGRARTWNESAIASAQYSGDAHLLGAALGHLGHLYLTWPHDAVTARQLIAQAQEYTRGHPVNGWFAMVVAATAAEEKNGEECEASIAKATEIVHSLPETAECSDLYYTDFNVAGVDAFAGNCFLKVGKPSLALERLTSINLGALAGNRHASAFYDMAWAYAQMGELEATQAYAFQAIDKAHATDRLYIIPRCITLAQGIQQRDPGEPHAAAILEYAHVALHEDPKGGRE